MYLLVRFSNTQYKDQRLLLVATPQGLSISSDGAKTFANKTMQDGLSRNNVSSAIMVNQNILAANGTNLSISSDGGKTFKNLDIGNEKRASLQSLFAAGCVVKNGSACIVLNVLLDASSVGKKPKNS